jgi:hypothetical protein
MTKKLLIIAVAGLVLGLAFVTGIVNVQNTVAFYVALPLGAVSLGLFLLFRILEKEAALYDQEQQANPAFQQATVATQDCDGSKHAHGKTAAAH